MMGNVWRPVRRICMPMIGCKGFEINVGMLTETSNESALSLSLSQDKNGKTDPATNFQRNFIHKRINW